MSTQPTPSTPLTPHTPTPWKVDPAHPTTICHGFSTVGELALTYGLQGALKNAAFIVEACNNYAALQTALTHSREREERLRVKLEECQEERDAALELAVSFEKLMTNDDGIDPEAWWIELGPDEAQLVRTLAAKIKEEPLPDYMKNAPLADVCEHKVPKGYYCKDCDNSAATDTTGEGNV